MHCAMCICQSVATLLVLSMLSPKTRFPNGFDGPTDLVAVKVTAVRACLFLMHVHACVVSPLALMPHGVGCRQGDGPCLFLMHVHACVISSLALMPQGVGCRQGDGGARLPASNACACVCRFSTGVDALRVGRRQGDDGARLPA